MRALALLPAAICLVGLSALASVPAQAASVLWVASSGNDSNPCTQAQPCGSFTRAIDLTPTNGEIRCVDFGNYGGFSILNKSIVIDCDESMASTGAGGMTITIGSIQAVVLKGLDSNGGHQNYGALHVMNIQGAGTVHLHNVTISGFVGSTGALKYAPSGPGNLLITDSRFSDNGTSGNILVRPVMNATANVLLERVTMAASIFGLKVDGNAQAGGQVTVEVKDSTAAHHTNNGFVASSNPGQAPVKMTITNSTAFGNGVAGAVAGGAQATLVVGNSSFTGNGIGLQQLTGSTLRSYGNNEVTGNTTDTVGTIGSIGAL